MRALATNQEIGQEQLDAPLRLAVRVEADRGQWVHAARRRWRGRAVSRPVRG
jgi:hypothetical protein